jgi:hypothetical protein
MGTWGTGSFDSDQALDWVGDLTESGDVSKLTQTVEAVVDEEPDVYLDAGTCVEAIAAAEVVAALLGRPGDLPEEVADWVSDHSSVDVGQLRQRCVVAIDIVLGDRSELRELWEDDEQWKRAIADLRERLGA